MRVPRIKFRKPIKPLMNLTGCMVMLTCALFTLWMIAWGLMLVLS